MCNFGCDWCGASRIFYCECCLCTECKGACINEDPTRNEALNDCSESAYKCDREADRVPDGTICVIEPEGAEMEHGCRRVINYVWKYFQLALLISDVGTDLGSGFKNIFTLHNYILGGIMLSLPLFSGLLIWWSIYREFNKVQVIEPNKNRKEKSAVKLYLIGHRPCILMPFFQLWYLVLFLACQDLMGVTGEMIYIRQEVERLYNKMCRIECWFEDAPQFILQSLVIANNPQNLGFTLEAFTIGTSFINMLMVMGNRWQDTFPSYIDKPSRYYRFLDIILTGIIYIQAATLLTVRGMGMYYQSLVIQRTLEISDKKIINIFPEELLTLFFCLIIRLFIILIHQLRKQYGRCYCNDRDKQFCFRWLQSIFFYRIAPFHWQAAVVLFLETVFFFFQGLWLNKYDLISPYSIPIYFTLSIIHILLCLRTVSYTRASTKLDKISDKIYTNFFTQQNQLPKGQDKILLFIKELKDFDDVYCDTCTTGIVGYINVYSPNTCLYTFERWLGLDTEDSDNIQAVNFLQNNSYPFKNPPLMSEPLQRLIFWLKMRIKFYIIIWSKYDYCSSDLAQVFQVPVPGHLRLGRLKTILKNSRKHWIRDELASLHIHCEENHSSMTIYEVDQLVKFYGDNILAMPDKHFVELFERLWRRLYFKAVFAWRPNYQGYEEPFGQFIQGQWDKLLNYCSTELVNMTVEKRNILMEFCKYNLPVWCHYEMDSLVKYFLSEYPKLHEQELRSYIRLETLLINQSAKPLIEYYLFPFGYEDYLSNHSLFNSRLLASASGSNIVFANASLGISAKLYLAMSLVHIEACHSNGELENLEFIRATDIEYFREKCVEAMKLSIMQTPFNYPVTLSKDKLSGYRVLPLSQYNPHWRVYKKVYYLCPPLPDWPAGYQTIIATNLDSISSQSILSFETLESDQYSSTSTENSTTV